MTKDLSMSERKILHALSANGGECLSLFRLAVEINVNYKTAWLNALRLSWSGLISAERIATQHGRPYRLRLTCGPTWPMALVGPVRETDPIVGGSNSPEMRAVGGGRQEARL